MTADQILGLTCLALAALITIVTTASWLADRRNRRRLKKWRRK